MKKIEDNLKEQNLKFINMELKMKKNKRVLILHGLNGSSYPHWQNSLQWI